MKRIYLSMVSLCLLGLCSCFDMDKYPEGELSSVNSFTSTTEITKYLNQFYESTLKINDKDVANSAIKEQSNSIGNPTGIAFGDSGLSEHGGRCGFVHSEAGHPKTGVLRLQRRCDHRNAGG